MYVYLCLPRHACMGTGFFVLSPDLDWVSFGRKTVLSRVQCAGNMLWRIKQERLTACPTLPYFPLPYFLSYCCVTHHYTTPLKRWSHFPGVLYAKCIYLYPGYMLWRNLDRLRPVAAFYTRTDHYREREVRAAGVWEQLITLFSFTLCSQIGDAPYICIYIYV